MGLRINTQHPMLKLFSLLSAREFQIPNDSRLGTQIQRARPFCPLRVFLFSKYRLAKSPRPPFSVAHRASGGTATSSHIKRVVHEPPQWHLQRGSFPTDSYSFPFFTFLFFFFYDFFSLICLYIFSIFIKKWHTLSFFNVNMIPNKIYQIFEHYLTPMIKLCFLGIF